VFLLDILSHRMSEIGQQLTSRGRLAARCITLGRLTFFLHW
jgi:hypothetical protein